ncbi:hypothetical protein VM1G_08910 [Cytospora mali]|uniref:Protein kinase domain-containing protein n=1 Tax=Cytospora mali TaxID=578113 RepID=A0A194WBH2_CYTMA|nr:hypothetical protein VM1G_08910 [Valsa mali]
MADDKLVVAVEGTQYTPFAYLIPDNDAARKCLASLGVRHQQSAPSDRDAKVKHQLPLYFEVAGSGHNGSWKLGKGNTRQPVDLQLCSSRSRRIKGPVLGIISIHPQSGAIMLQNVSQNHSIIYLHGNGHANVELHYQEKHILYMTRNHLRFGPLHYVLEFCVDNESVISASRTDYIRKFLYNDEPPIPLLDPLPKPTHLRIGDVILHQTVSKGAFGVVRVGISSRSGDVVACKTVYCGQRDITSVKNEITFASMIPASTVGVMPLLYTWCEHGHSPPCFDAEIEAVHLLMPYAPLDFSRAPWPEIPPATRLSLFRQLLEGLRTIHSAGIMHRDISLRNSLILSLDDSKPQAAICDFGKSKLGSTGRETALGPQVYIAPEVWRRGGYTNAIDIFSLGLTFLYTFGPLRGPVHRMDESGHKLVLEHLTSLQGQGYMPAQLGALLRSMLSWDPAERPTAEQALDHGAWREITATAPDHKRPSSESSFDSGCAAGSGRKRVQRSDGPSPESPPRSRRRGD